MAPNSIPEVLTALAKQRPIFHSEADFQHALAWEIHERLPDASIRLERPVPHLNRLIHVDVWIERRDYIVAVELKYKTRALTLNVANEHFALLNQSAQDLGRYDFIKDVQRVERIVADRAPRAMGYAIVLTNDPSYWSQPRSSQTFDAGFRLQEGRKLQGTFEWGVGASEGARKGREAPLQLSGMYLLQWHTYSQPSCGSAGTFRYLAVEVNSDDLAHGS